MPTPHCKKYKQTSISHLTITVPDGSLSAVFYSTFTNSAVQAVVGRGRVVAAVMKVREEQSCNVSCLHTADESP